MANLNHLPIDILLDIITRLPTESILDCKSVCKSWRNLVSDHPSFSQLHLTHLNQSTDSGKLSFLVLAENDHLYYFEYNETGDETPIYSITRFNLNPLFRNFSFLYKVVGSINGLVCLYVQLDCAYCVCNPVTREKVMVPNINGKRDDHIYSSSGFGYHPLTNEYKIVELYMLKGKHNFVEVAVYTLGSREGWRNVGRFDSEEKFNTDGVFASGALHWVDVKGRRVLAFDLTEEKFREHITLPPLPPNHKSFHRYTFQEFGKFFCYFRGTSEDVYTDIRLFKQKNDDIDMKDQVEHKPLGWRKVFRLPEGRKPLSFTKSGGVLCYHYRSLGIYDPIAPTLKEIVDWIPFHEIFPHRNTLVSLKELGEEEIKTMEPAEIEET